MVLVREQIFDELQILLQLGLVRALKTDGNGLALQACECVDKLARPDQTLDGGNVVRQRYQFERGLGEQTSPNLLLLHTLGELAVSLVVYWNPVIYFDLFLVPLMVQLHPVATRMVVNWHT